MNETQSARRYARAIIETATDARAVRDDLAAISQALTDHPDLLKALTNPAVPPANKKAICSAIFRDLAPPLPRLLDLLIDASRVELAPEIAPRYREEWNGRNNVHAAKVTSAAVLEPQAVEALREALGVAVSGSVEIETATDPALVGGLRVEVGGQLFDGTVKARLLALRRHLLQA